MKKLPLLLFIFSLGILKAQVNLNSGLSAYYPFNGNVKDSTGNANHGTTMGSPTLTTNRWGQPNTCYRFNGNGDYVRVPDDNSKLEPPAALTVSAWVYCEDFSSWNVVVCKRAAHNANPYNSYILYAAGAATQPQNWSFIISPSQSTSYDVTQSSTLQTTKWVHLVGTYDSTTANGNNLKLYVDGQLVQSRKISGAIYYTDSSLRIGMAIPGTSLQYFKGKIDDVRLYNRAINQQEVTALYNEEFHIYKTVNYEICLGDSILLGGKYRKNTGTYVDTIKSSNFDTVKTSNLLVNLTVTTPSTITICQGNSFLVGGKLQTTGGIYYDTLKSSKGCDSIIVTTLVVNPTFLTLRTIEICQGNGFLAGGKLQTTGGIYYDTLKSAKNCDSIIVTTLVVNPIFLTLRAIEICKGNSILLGGIQRTQAGVYYDSLKNSKGCDSIIKSTLIINPTFIQSQSFSICQGDSAKIGTKFRNQPGTYIDTLKTNKNCDSVVISSLVVYPKYNIVVNATICKKTSILINGRYYSKAGTYIDSFKTKFGCDSLMQVNITEANVNISVTQNVNVLIAIATGASYRWLDCNNSYFPIQGQTLQSFIAPTTGNYAVAISQNSCTDTSICYFVPSGMGIDEFSTSTTKIYPNPAKNELKISGNSLEGLSVKIFDCAGKLVIDHPKIENNNISVNQLSSGVYYIQITNAPSGIIQTEKLIIQQ